MFTKYLELSFPTSDFNKETENLTGKTPYSVMNKVFGKTGWTYSIKTITFGAQKVFAIVTLAMPGMVRDGSAFGKDYEDAITQALWNVIDTLDVHEAPLVKEPTPIPQPVQAPIPQIQQPATVTATPPLHTQTQVITPAVTPAVPATTASKPQTEDDSIKLLANMFKISFEQASSLHDVRKKYKINTKDQLFKYMQNWDSTLTTVTQLTAQNVDAFLTWANNETPKGFEEVTV